jgi:glutaminyl-tRNA synthetase
VLSKRRLIQLVEEGHVEGWDDPRMPTLAGAPPPRLQPGGIPHLRRAHRRRQGRLVDRVLDPRDCMREHLNEVAPRRMAVLDPVKLVIENYPEGRTSSARCPTTRRSPTGASARLPFSRELWIEREDFAEKPPKGYFRLLSGNKVRLRYGFVIECTG